MLTLRRYEHHSYNAARGCHVHAVYYVWQLLAPMTVRCANGRDDILIGFDWSNDGQQQRAVLAGGTIRPLSFLVEPDLQMYG